MAKPLLTGGNGKANDFVGSASGQIPTWSETAQEWVPLPGGGGSGGGGALFYLNSATAAASPTGNVPGGSGGATAYFTPAQTSQTFTATASTRLSPPTGELPSDGSWAIVQGFLSDDALGLTTIPPGLWDFNIWAEASTGAGATQTEFRIKVGVYDGTNAPTIISTSDGTYIYDPEVAAQYAVSVVIPSNTISATDRLYIEIDARASANNRTATFYFGGVQPSHVHTTILAPIDLATDVTGTLPTENGGTGADLSAGAVGAIPYVDSATPATMALLASGAGDSGKFLRSNGANAPSWESVASSNYDLRNAFVGTPASSLVIDRFVADRNFTISATGTNHKFSALNKPSSGSVVLTLQRTRTTGSPSTVTIFEATSDSTDTILNGYYPMTIGAVSNNSIEVNDVIELVVQAGAVNSQFTTPMWTIYGTAS